MSLDHLIDTNVGSGSRAVKIKGTVLLMKKNAFDFNDFHASLLDGIKEVLGNKVTLQLISAEATDPENSSEGKLGIPAHLENWITTMSPLTAGESAFSVTFDYEEGFGYPGAFIVRNNHHCEFYLKSLTLDGVPGYGHVHFVCNSWVYPVKYYKQDRVFFSNKTYLPSETPAPLLSYREEELMSLKGTGEGELNEWDRVYDYALYNDLSDPKNPRPVLGGSAEYPYPRRGRTSRKPSEEGLNCESRLPVTSTLDIYVPRDERFGYLKQSDAFAYGLKGIFQAIQPVLDSVFDETPNEFDSFEDVLNIYEKGIDFPGSSMLAIIMKKIPMELIKETFRKDSDKLFQFPTPQIIKEDKSAWRSDEEFAREMLAGLNPVIIRLLQEFPIKSKLDREIYGDQNSTISKGQIEHNLDGLTIEEALTENRLFILDHHDTLMPLLRRINTTSTKTYASRTLLFLKDDGTLKPLLIELSLPHPNGDEFGAISEVYSPAEQGVENSLWQLAKAYVGVNDSGHHQLISHWLHTHATIEPFVIATNRQLSVLHPVYKLLQPHLHGTMNINALSRQTLINGGGLLEATVFTAKYSLEMSSFIYKHHWVFSDQALPADLKKRGLAVDDPNSPHGLRLLIKDYPYAVDGLEIWSAIQTWVTDYIRVYYKTDDSIQTDNELQSWWKEVREEGHGDKKDETWWPNLQTRDELIESCTIIIWIASALHAAINFGQYPYGGFLPNRPSISRRFIPKKGTPEFEELMSNPDKVLLKTITAQLQTLLGISIIEILSMHSSDEVYLGQRDSAEWTDDSEALDAFDRFGKRLEEIEEKIMERNKDEGLKNRVGPVKMPYTLLIPSSEAGLTGKGIPNSIAI